jgi:hypothetical protein
MQAGRRFREAWRRKNEFECLGAIMNHVLWRDIFDPLFERVLAVNRQLIEAEHLDRVLAAGHPVAGAGREIDGPNGVADGHVEQTFFGRPNHERLRFEAIHPVMVHFEHTDAGVTARTQEYCRQ